MAVFITTMSLLSYSSVASPVKPINLRCEYRPNPLGIDTKEPRLSWILESDKRGERQTGYQILVASTPELLLKDQGDLWDSGKVNSDQTILVSYKGKPLSSQRRYYWKARVWDKNGTISSWSKPAFWSMGLLSTSDWQGKWIGLSENERIPDKGKRYVLPIFRRTFSIEKEIKSATVYICGLGQYELYLNGEKVGNNVYDPGWTNYRKTCLYTTYDVTEKVKKGANAFGIMLGNAFYNYEGGRHSDAIRSFGPPKVIMQLHLLYTDGSSASIISDEKWKVTKSPIVYSDVFGGEDYDARIEQPEWTKQGFNDSSWQSSVIVDGPGGKLVSQCAPPVKIMETFKPVKITEPSPGAYIYDFGQNCSGRPKITVKGKAGDQIKLTPEEVLHDDGTLKQREHFGPCYFTYTLKGDGEETWTPLFSSYGFRYIRIESVDIESGRSKPQILSIESEHARSSAETIGSFSCSNDLFNQIHTLINWAIKVICGAY